MSSEDHKATIRRLAEAFNKRDLSFIDHAFSPHFVLHTALTPGWPQGLAGARQMFTTMLTTASDMYITIEDLFAEDDKVAVRWIFRGTHTGPSLSRGALTGQPFTVAAIAIYRFANGKIEEDWGVDAQWQTGAVWK